MSYDVSEYVVRWLFDSLQDGEKMTDLSQIVLYGAEMRHSHRNGHTHAHIHTQMHTHAHTPTSIHADKHTHTQTHSDECNKREFHTFHVSLKNTP